MRRRDLSELLDQLSRGSRGIVTRAELLHAGLSSSSIDRCCLTGELVRLHPGVFRRGLADQLSTVLADVLAAGGVASHDSAALLWQLDMTHPPGRHVTVGRTRSRLTHDAGVCLHRVDLPSADVEVRAGVPVTTALRTVLDCARHLELRPAVVVADSALRGGLLTLEEVRAGAAAARGPASSRVRQVAALADPAAASPLESVLRVELTLAGLPPTHSQYQVRDPDGRLMGIADFCYLLHRLVIEADGFAFHSSRTDVRRDRRKTNGYALAGFRLLRFSWEDVLHDPRYVVATVAAELGRPVANAG